MAEFLLDTCGNDGVKFRLTRKLAFVTVLVFVTVGLSHFCTIGLTASIVCATHALRLGLQNLAVFRVVAPVGTVKHTVSWVIATSGLTFASVAGLSSGVTIARLFHVVAVKGFAFL